MYRLIFRAEVPSNGSYQIKFGLLDDETCRIQTVTYEELMHTGFEVINMRWENTIAKMLDSQRGLPYITLNQHNQDVVYYALETSDSRVLKLISNTGKVCIMSWNVLSDWLSVGSKYVSNLVTVGGLRLNTAMVHTTALQRSLEHAWTK